MSGDLIVIIIFSVMGLAAHGARNHAWMEWTLRVIFSFAFVAELWTAFVVLPGKEGGDISAWSIGVTAVMATLTGFILFRPCRVAMSYALSAANDLVSGQLLYARWALKKFAEPVPSYVPVAEVPPVEAPKVAEAPKVEEALPAPVAEAPKSDEPAVAAESPADAVDSPSSSDSSLTAIEGATASEPSEGASPATPAEEKPAEEKPAEERPVEPKPTKFGTRLPSLVATAAPIVGAKSIWDYWLRDRVFMPDSIPHLNAAWIYITVLGSLLANLNLDNFAVPTIGIPFPVPLDSLFSYNFLGLIMLAFCGAGIIVARRPMECLERLGLVKPKGWHIGVALLMVPVTFLYDYVWSLFTEGSGVGSKLGMYNSGTFMGAGANPGPAAFLALATGLCAGAGEEILMRGGLQPVFGIIPTGLLHGALHGQFSHAPILILQVAGWSCIMGIVRRYTNTTTTLITHATWNFITTFLFAFNP
jgi:hypothetical protein